MKSFFKTTILTITTAILFVAFGTTDVGFVNSQTAADADAPPSAQTAPPPEAPSPTEPASAPDSSLPAPQPPAQVNPPSTATPHQRPSISSVVPSSTQAGAPVTVTIVGSSGSFTPESVATFNGLTQPTTFNGSNALSVDLSASDTATPGRHKVGVVSPPSEKYGTPPNGTVFNPEEFIVYPKGQPSRKPRIGFECIETKGVCEEKEGGFHTLRKDCEDNCKLKLPTEFTCRIADRTCILKPDSFTGTTYSSLEECGKKCPNAKGTAFHCDYRKGECSAGGGGDPCDGPGDPKCKRPGLIIPPEPGPGPMPWPEPPPPPPMPEPIPPPPEPEPIPPPRFCMWLPLWFPGFPWLCGIPEPPVPGPEPEPGPILPPPEPEPGPKLPPIFEVSNTLPEGEPLKPCFICDYEEVLECSTGEASKSKKNCEDAREDCEWIKGKCRNRFMVRCENRIKEKKSYYDWTEIVNSTRTTPKQISELWPKDCTIEDYISEGHSGQHKCSELFNFIELCIVSSPGTNLNFLNNGCSTFKNRYAAMRYAEYIQSIISPKCVVEASGNQEQFNLDGTCTSRMTVTITCEKITVGYGPCYKEGTDFCYKGSINGTILCTSEEGEVVSQICCETGKQINSYYYTGGEPITSAWFRGTKCKSSPPPDGLCLGEARRYWCSGAKKDALAEADVCLNNEERICNEKGQTFIREACTTKTWNGVEGIFRKCSARATCPWRCVSAPQHQ